MTIKEQRGGIKTESERETGRERERKGQIERRIDRVKQRKK